MCKLALVLSLLAAGACGHSSLDGPSDAAIAPVASGWHFESPLPQGSTLYDAWGSAADDVWAVGGNGALLHFDGQRWSVLPQTSHRDLKAIWGSAADDVWIVGTHGTLLHYDGTSWSQASTPVVEDLADVWGTAADDVWIVGHGGTILHDDGSGWSPVPSGTTLPLLTIDGTGASDVWVGGGAACAECGPGVTTVLHGGRASDGTLSFTQIGVPKQIPLAIWAEAPGSAWIGGNLGLQHIEGDGLDAVAASPAVGVFAFGHDAAGDVWASTSGGIYRKSGASWVASATTPDFVYGVWALSATEAWAVGAGGLTTHFDGTQWTELLPAITRDFVWKVWGSSTHDVYAVSQLLDGPVHVLHYDGNAWALVDLPTDTIGTVSALWGTGPSDVWIAGKLSASEPGLLHFDGKTWRTTPVAALAQITALWSSAPGKLWILGQSSASIDTQLVLQESSSGWTSHTLPTIDNEAATSMWGSGDEVFVTTIVGESAGNLYRGDGTSWKMETIADFFPTSLSGTSSSDLWAIGYASTGAWHVAHRGADATWTTTEPPTIDDADYSGTALIGIFGVSANEVYATYGNAVLSFDGTSWRQDSELGDNGLAGVWASEGNVWAVGAHGTILRKGP